MQYLTSKTSLLTFVIILALLLFYLWFKYNIGLSSLMQQRAAWESRYDELLQDFESYTAKVIDLISFQSLVLFMIKKYLICAAWLVLIYNIVFSPIGVYIQSFLARIMHGFPAFSRHGKLSVLKLVFWRFFFSKCTG